MDGAPAVDGDAGSSPSEGGVKRKTAPKTHAGSESNHESFNPSQLSYGQTAREFELFRPSLDFKTSFGAVSKEQFQQFIMIANQDLGLKVSLVMPKKPTPGEVAIMEKWAKEVSTKTDEKDILFSVIHLLD